MESFMKGSGKMTKEKDLESLLSQMDKNMKGISKKEKNTDKEWKLIVMETFMKVSEQIT